MNLGTLLAQYKRLQDEGKTTEEKARRGLAFERLLADLFRLQGILMTEPFRITGEQIDGAFEYKGWTYLVEAKWQRKKQSTNALYSFQGKTDRRIEGTRGLFISVSGFHKTSVERFETGRKPNILLWTGEHIEAVLKGRTTVPELLDLSLSLAAEQGKLLISPEVLLTSRDESLFEAVLQACAAQVDAEISSMVGKRFIPGLYVEREAQERLDALIYPERHIKHLLSELSELDPSICITNPVSKNGEAQGQRRTLIDLVEYVRSLLERISRPHGGTLREFLDTLPEELSGRMHILIARAATGKTNLLCHLATHYVKDQPTIFLTGRSGITEKTSIKELIESKLSRFAVDPLPRQHLFDRLVSLVERLDSSLLVFLDAMNEHRYLELLSAALAQFLLEIGGKPVVIVASCRDVYWPFFDTSTWPEGQWSRHDLDLDVFSPNESERAIDAYFDFYRIDTSLSEEARDRLAHPLILRFFCEAYGNPSSPGRIELHEIHDIRLKVLFDDYLTRKLDSIRLTAPRRRRTSREIRDFLFSLADWMRQTRSREVDRDDIRMVTGQTDLESPESVYVAILGEDIILEEEPEEETGRINVLFTYDEFMEYMIARSMIRGCYSLGQESVAQLIQECQRGVEAFPSFVGVFEYLSVILREERGLVIWDAIDFDLTAFGLAVRRAIEKLGPDFLGTQEVRVLGKMVFLPDRRLRASATRCLSAIIRGKRYQKRWRARAVEILKEVLMQEKDTWIRYDAASCFEADEITSLSEMAQDIHSWWRSEKKQMVGRVILSIQPARDMLELIDSVLRLAGFNNVHGELGLSRYFHNPSELLRAAERVKPSLIIVGGGPWRVLYQIIKSIRADLSFAEIPILALPTATVGWNREVLFDSFCGVCPMPFDADRLTGLVRMSLVGKFEEQEKG